MHAHTRTNTHTHATADSAQHALTLSPFPFFCCTLFIILFSTFYLLFVYLRQKLELSSERRERGKGKGRVGRHSISHCRGQLPVVAQQVAAPTPQPQLRLRFLDCCSYRMRFD